MADFLRNEKGIGYLTLSLKELKEYNELYCVCDECLKELTDTDKIVLLPILNEAYCCKCGTEKINRIIDYPEDRPIRKKREDFYKSFYEIEERE